MHQRNKGTYKAIVIGVSTGGVAALKFILSELPSNFSLPILIVSHIAPGSDDGLAILFDTLCGIKVKEADELEKIVSSTVYLAPANYHMLVEKGGFISLSVDPPVHFARPSVDVLFESAADVYCTSLIGVILTGAGADGSNGLQKIKLNGGKTIVQDPLDAEMGAMPKSALQLQEADYIVPLNEIPSLLMKLSQD